jgi:dTDP-4-amino-4,6-dideoxygalactose transaminase
MSVPDTVRHGAQQVIFETYPELGYNYRMTDLQAAVGRVQLSRVPDIIVQRRNLAARYHAALARIPGLQPPLEPPWARSNWQSYCVLLPEAVDQRAVMQAMLDAGISTRRGVMCAHRELPYADAAATPLPNSERVQDSGIILPLHAAVTDEDVSMIADVLARAL